MAGDEPLRDAYLCADKPATIRMRVLPSLASGHMMSKPMKVHAQPPANTGKSQWGINTLCQQLGLRLTQDNIIGAFLEFPNGDRVILHRDRYNQLYVMVETTPPEYPTQHSE